MEINEEKLMLHIFVAFQITCLITFSFDIFMTYRAYSSDKEYFFIAEANRQLVGELKEGTRFMFSSTIQLLLLIYCAMLFMFYFSIKRYPKRITYIIFIAFIIYFCIRIGFHVYGGMSWLLW